MDERFYSIEMSVARAVYDLYGRSSTLESVRVAATLIDLSNEENQ